MNYLFSKRFLRSATFGGSFDAVYVVLPIALAARCSLPGLVVEPWYVGGSDFVGKLVPLGFGVGTCTLIWYEAPTEAALVTEGLALGCGDAELMC